MENKEYSFWNLISTYTIEIPGIQRDYAQGRKEESRIANVFINDLHNALQANKKINLHFIYGNNDSQQLIPLDGQQRLTTLFLLHWFLSIGTISKENKAILSKFRYETRPSSEDFCLKLVKESIEYDSEKSISDQIIDAKWFFLSWKNDPTISAMLNMLDVIQSKFKEPNADLFNLLLGEQSSIKFHFLPLKQFKLGDEIYVKMNSRGKPLTEFENFKANFSVLFGDTQKSKLDNEWLDIFWKLERDHTRIDINMDNTSIDIDKVDGKYFNFIKNISFCFYAEKNDIDKEEKDNFNIFDRYKEIFNSDYLSKISRVLDALTTFNDVEKYLAGFLEYKLEYVDYLHFYAVAQFFIHREDFNVENYYKWIRVCRNLINNSLIQSPDDFCKAIRSIKQLAAHIPDIYEYLSAHGNKISGFLQVQCDEEQIKAELLLKDNSGVWRKEIVPIENHPYFDGQIGFILEFAKSESGYDIDLFADYSEKLNILFGDKFQYNHYCLFQRALLTFGDYLVDISKHKTFCTFNKGLREKTDNWRKVFNDKNKNIFLKSLLNSISIDNIESDLRRLIDEYPENNNKWESLFIKNKGIIEYCMNYQIALRGNKTVLARSTAPGWERHAELVSYVFYKKQLENKYGNFAPFTRTFYWDTSDGVPCAVIDEWKANDCNLALNINYQDNHFELQFFDRNGHDIPEEIKQKINEYGFKKQDTCWKYIIEGNIDFDKVEGKIKEFFSGFAD